MRTTLWAACLSLLAFLPAASADALAQASGTTGSAVWDAIRELLQSLGIPASAISVGVAIVVFLCGQLGKAEPMDLRFTFRGRLFSFRVQKVEETAAPAAPRERPRLELDPTDPPEPRQRAAIA